MAKLGLTVFSIFLFLVPAHGAAQEKDDSPSFIHELKGGVLAHDVDGLWSGFSREDGVDINAEVIFTPSVDLLGGTLRPALGTSINTGGDTSKLYLKQHGTFFKLNLNTVSNTLIPKVRF